MKKISIFLIVFIVSLALTTFVFAQAPIDPDNVNSISKFKKVNNVSGVTIPAGGVVVGDITTLVAGTIGVTSTTTASDVRVLGVAPEAIPTGETGIIQTHGVVTALFDATTGAVGLTCGAGTTAFKFTAGNTGAGSSFNIVAPAGASSYKVFLKGLE